MGAHGDHTGRGQVGVGLIVQVKQLLELLHCLQRKAPFSNLDQAVEVRTRVSEFLTLPVKTALHPPQPPYITLKINIKMLKKNLFQKEKVSQDRNSAHLDLHGCRAAIHTQHQSKQDAGSSHFQTISMLSQLRVSFCCACPANASYKLLGFRSVSDLLTQAPSVKGVWANTDLVTDYMDRILFFTL